MNKNSAWANDIQRQVVMDDLFEAWIVNEKYYYILKHATYKFQKDVKTKNPQPEFCPKL